MYYDTIYYVLINIVEIFDSIEKSDFAEWLNVNM